MSEEEKIIICSGKGAGLALEGAIIGFAALSHGKGDSGSPEVREVERNLRRALDLINGSMRTLEAEFS